MRRLVVGSAILALAAATFSWALADDQEIARKVAERLKHEQKEGNLQGFDINLKVAEGKVTLKGTVSSIEQRELAVGSARRVDGVTTIVNELQVNAATESGAADASRRSLAEQETPRKTLLSGLMQSITGRGASESGRGHILGQPSEANPAKVASTESGETVVARRPASHSAPTPATVTSTLDQAPAAKILSAAQMADDQRIGEELTRGLQDAKRDGRLKGFGISLHVENGHVWMKGRVASASQQQTALELARRTAGVRQVINELTVGEPAANIAQNLNEHLQAAEKEGSLRGSDLNVKVDGPDVWLTGTISRPEQEKLAVDLARAVPGVRRVISGLELSRISQASMPAAVPMASLLPPAVIPVARLDRPQSEPAAAVPPAQMALPQRPQVQEMAAVEAVPNMEPVRDLRFAMQAPAGLENATLTEVTPAAAPSVAVEPVQNVAAVMPASRPATMPAAMPMAGASFVPMPSNALPAAGGYVYYSPYPMTQASLPVMPVDQTPRPLGLPQMASYAAGAAIAAPVMAISHATGMMPAQLPGPGHAVVPARYDHPSLPGYAWPTYAAHPNYAAVTYPKQYSPSAWPYIGPFYPYPQVPLGWRKVTLKWDDGWWNLDFKAK